MKEDYIYRQFLLSQSLINSSLWFTSLTFDVFYMWLSTQFMINNHYQISGKKKNPIQRSVTTDGVDGILSIRQIYTDLCSVSEEVYFYRSDDLRKNYLVSWSKKPKNLTRH